MATVTKQIKNKTYTVLRPVADNEKCPPQAKVILDTITELGTDVPRADLLKALSRPVEEGGIKTNQTVERILGFYRPRLVAMGVLREDEVVTEVEVEVPDASAKPDAPAKAAKVDEAKPAKNVKGKKGKARHEEPAPEQEAGEQTGEAEYAD